MSGRIFQSRILYGRRSRPRFSPMKSTTQDIKTMPPDPLGPYIDLYARQLRSQRYAPPSVGRKLQVVGRFSRWLYRKHVAATEVTSKHATDYLQSCQPDHGLVRRGDQAAIMGLIKLLGDLEVTQAGGSQPTPTPCQRWLKDYDNYLEKERSLSVATRTNYVPFAQHFLLDRFGLGPVDLSALQATDVLRFVRRAAAGLKGKRVLLMTTALRSFLRFAVR
jgi:integrase/recombinase XerD